MSTTKTAPSGLPHSLILVGAGRMGGAMLQGWLASGLDPARVAVVDPNPAEAVEALAHSAGFPLNPDIASLDPAEVVVLAIKPQALADVARTVMPLVRSGTLLLSILAGKQVEDLRGALPGAEAIVRAMPNLPASIGKGATGAFASERTNARQRKLADALLAAVGLVEWVEREELIDSITAVSGSGPAYLFHLVECLAIAARDAGLDPALSDRLARATVTGAADLLASSGSDPAALRRDVTSPGGTTEAALQVLMGEAGLAALMRDAVLAAKRRARELSG